MRKFFLINSKVMSSVPYICPISSLFVIDSKEHKISRSLIMDFFFKQNCFYVIQRYKMMKFFKCIKKIFYRYKIGYSARLELYGLSYTATKKSNVLRLNVGYTHSVYYRVPADVFINTKKKLIYLFSFSLFRLTSVLAEIIQFKPLSPYKLKGIKNKDVLYVKKKMNLTK